MFPQGGPGLALLLLRISVATTFFVEAQRRFGNSSFYHILFAATLLTSSFLTIGFLTPLLSFAVCISAASALLIGLPSDSLVLVLLVLDSAALGLLGPGAYSLDARLFGRRVIVVPARQDSDQF